MKSVLIVYRKSFLQESKENDFESNILKQIQQKKLTPQMNAILNSHQENSLSREFIIKTCNDLGLTTDTIDRNKLLHIEDNKYDLVISVGGDGTALHVASKINNTPLLALNSAPSYSVGRLCCISSHNAKEILEKILSKNQQPITLHRLTATLNGKLMNECALNDILITHQHPAGVCKYKIEINENSEVHKNSGIWISSSAGSTAGIRSAGGQIQEITDSRFQYKAREMCCRSGVSCQFFQGFIENNQHLKVTLLIPKGYISFDGHIRSYAISYTDELIIQNNQKPLRIYLI